MKAHTSTIQVNVNTSEQERQLLQDFSSQTRLEVSQADILMERSFLFVVCERNCWIHHHLHSGKRTLGENKFGKQFNIGFKRDDVRVKSEEV